MRYNIKIVNVITMAAILASLLSCEKESPGTGSISALKGNGFFVVNEGNFRSGNSSLTFYSYDSASVYNNIFSGVNERPLGDVAHSASVASGILYIVVNNSGKIEIAETESLMSSATVSGLNSPRFIGPISKSKAYVSSLYSDSIAIINPETAVVSGYINLSMSSEQIVVSGKRAYVSNWSGESTMTIIDIETDAILNILDLAKEPGRLVIDASGKGWILCSGGYLNEDYPELFRVDLLTGQILRNFQFEDKTESPSELCIDNSGTRLFFINNDIFMMQVEDQGLPAEPLVEASGRNFYRMDFDKRNGVLLVTDAMDFMQRGYIYGYTPEGVELISFRGGIIPGSFCFK